MQLTLDQQTAIKLAELSEKMLELAFESVWNNAQLIASLAQVNVRDFNPNYEGGQAGKRRYRVLLREYSLGDKSNGSYTERFGLNL